MSRRLLMSRRRLMSSAPNVGQKQPACLLLASKHFQQGSCQADKKRNLDQRLGIKGVCRVVYGYVLSKRSGSQLRSTCPVQSAVPSSNCVRPEPNGPSSRSELNSSTQDISLAELDPAGMTEEHGNDGAGRVRECATGRLSERSTEFKLKRTKLEAETSPSAGRASHQHRNESPSFPCTRYSRC
jgi:hypothetical protein